MFRVLISIFLPLVVSTENDSTEYVGEPASEGQFPYLISLKSHLPELKANEYVNVCGGALIGPSWVLTNAHCFEKPINFCQYSCKKPQFYDAKRYYAVAGSLQNYQMFEADGQWRGIKKFIVHDDYWIIINNVAIAHTNKPFELNNNVNVIPFAREYKDYGNIQCELAGFGVKYLKNKEAAGLTVVNIQLVPAERCALQFILSMRMFICTEVTKTNGLNGDALVCKNTGDKNDKGQGIIVGIESSPLEYAKDNTIHIEYKNLVTRVSHFSDFIAKGESCEAPRPESLIILLSIIVSSVYC